MTFTGKLQDLGLPFYQLLVISLSLTLILNKILRNSTLLEMNPEPYYFSQRPLPHLWSKSPHLQTKLLQWSPIGLLNSILAILSFILHTIAQNPPKASYLTLSRSRVFPRPNGPSGSSLSPGLFPTHPPQPILLIPFPTIFFT